MVAKESIANWAWGVAGAVVGGTLGYLAFFWFVRQGFYALALPGALLGLGCGLFAGTRSHMLGVASGVLAVALGLFTEWRFAPFIDDSSFWYFLTHVHQLKSATLIMIAIGALFGYWFGTGREGGVWRRHKQTGTAE